MRRRAAHEAAALRDGDDDFRCGPVWRGVARACGCFPAARRGAVLTERAVEESLGCVARSFAQLQRPRHG